jgi:hypothetical protein
LPAASAFRAYSLRLGPRFVARGVIHCSPLLAPNQRADRAGERDQQRDNARDDEYRRLAHAQVIDPGRLPLTRPLPSPR